jgi:hypothetical protein
MADTSMEEASSTAVDKIATSICNSHARYCDGRNTQYASWSECYRFLTADVRVGQSFELGMNTLMCRSMNSWFRTDQKCIAVILALREAESVMTR